MKRLLVVLSLVMSIMVLSGCEYIIPPVSSSELQVKLMATREIIRESNVGIRVEVSAEGITNRNCSFTSKGSGAVYKEDSEYYYVLTNFHVVNTQECTNVEYAIYLLNFAGEEDTVDAELVIFDEDYDLAVIKFLKDDYIIPLIDIDTRLGTALKRGEMVLSVGNPSGLDAIVTYGEYLRMTNIDLVDFPVIYHTAMIYSGNSGGMLTDIEGALIGINTWGNPSNTEGLAVPLIKIHEFLTLYDLQP
ncbi:S1 family peptidase [Liberiplasma polymorphum]|uniref:S1 family peptidase n=1 Tax=Liberiplasma polymorphum TaxID=3374570 RepID=UPI0037768077